MSEFEENQEGTWGLPDSEPEPGAEPEPTGFEALPEPTETSDALTYVTFLSDLFVALDGFFSPFPFTPFLPPNFY